MNRNGLFLIAAVIMICLGPVSAAAATINVDSWSYDHNGINLDHGNAVIHGNDGTEARITPDGALFIAGKSQSVTSAQKQQLIRYVQTVQDMETRGVQLGREAGSFAASMVGEVMADLFSGASGDQIDRKANQRAHDFKQKALPICKDAQTLKQLQDTLTAGLPAFKPYAVIEGDDVNDCQHDIESDD